MQRQNYQILCFYLSKTNVMLNYTFMFYHLRRTDNQRYVRLLKYMQLKHLHPRILPFLFIVFKLFLISDDGEYACLRHVLHSKFAWINIVWFWIDAAKEKKAYIRFWRFGRAKEKKPRVIFSFHVGLGSGCIFV